MWDHPNPVFLDFETQSACDLQESGSRAYASHESTRILILSTCVDDVFHVWIPDYIKVNSLSWDSARLWPFRLKPKKEVRLYRGTSPREILARIHDRPLCAHNAIGFDRLIWDRFFGPHKPGWIDTLYLARIEGRPGKLDKLAKSLVEVGKDRAARLMKQLTTATRSTISDGYSYPIIRPGDLQAFTTYAIQDVELLVRMWPSFEETPVEVDVIEAHNKINDRGICADIDLLSTVESLAAYSVTRACEDIADLTDGKLHENNIRSGKQVHDWLARYGVHIIDDRGKPVEEQKHTLRKDIVQRFIDSPYVIDDYMVAAKEIPPLVIEVLKLRMKALRITDAKVERLKDRAEGDHRIRDMQVYHAAHTGRWSSQIHNLPKPHRTIGDNIEEFMKLVQGKLKHNIPALYDRIKEELRRYDSSNIRSAVTVDDVCSALIRPSLMAKKGYALTIADYSSVEGCGVSWIADEEKQLQMYREGRDIYREFAGKVFNKPAAEVTKDERDGVGKIGILGLGYSMSAHKFRIYAANWGVDLVKAGVTAEQCVETYRDEFIKIAGFKPNRNDHFRVQGVWQKLDRAVRDCVSKREETCAGKCVFRMEGRDLICYLPSGRRIYYPDARIEDVIPPYCYTMGLPLTPKATVIYTGARGDKSLYGGIITENIVQAICRDLLATALVKLEECNLSPVFHAHDEAVDEVEERIAKQSLRHQVTIMSEVPPWAIGFPIKCEGFVSKRFVKKAWEGSYKYSTKDLVTQMERRP